MAKVIIPEVNLNETPAWDGEAQRLPPGEFAFEVAEDEAAVDHAGNAVVERRGSIGRRLETRCAHARTVAEWNWMSTRIEPVPSH